MIASNYTQQTDAPLFWFHVEGPGRDESAELSFLTASLCNHRFLIGSSYPISISLIYVVFEFPKYWETRVKEAIKKI